MTGYDNKLYKNKVIMHVYLTLTKMSNLNAYSFLYLLLLHHLDTHVMKPLAYNLQSISATPRNRVSLQD